VPKVIPFQQELYILKLRCGAEAEEVVINQPLPVGLDTPEAEAVVVLM
jgi:hypothetical protein